MKWIKLLRDYGGYKAGEMVQVERAIADAYIASSYAEETEAPEQALATAAAAEVRAAVASLGQELATQFRNAINEVRGIRIEAGEQQDDKTRSLADQVRCIVDVTKRSDREAYDRLTKVYKSTCHDENGRELRAYEEAIGSNGGWMIAPAYSTEILRVPQEVGPFIARARNVPMTSPIQYIPAVRQTGVPVTGSGGNPQSSRGGGVRTFRRTEKAQRPPTDSKFDQVKLEATDLIAYTEATNDLLMSAPNAENFFIGLYRDEIAWRRNYDATFGPGNGEPQGYLPTSNTCQISVNRSTANEIRYVDVMGMLTRFLSSSWPNGVWIASITTIPQLAQLRDAAGNFIWLGMQNGQAGAADGMPTRLLNMPLFFSEIHPVLGTRGDLVLVDPQQYLDGNYSGIEIAVSREFRFDTDMTAYRLKLRNDGRPWMDDVIRLADGANTTVAPFVILN